MAQARQFTLLLLYDKVASALPVAQALKDKEIDVIVVQNAGELIQMIAQKKTDMVGLSVNHASTPSLIRVLQDKTKVQIMVFGEDKHPNTAKKVDKAAADIKIAGIANGYNIFMKIGHLVKSRIKTAENSKSIMFTGGGTAKVAVPGESKLPKKKKSSTFMVRSKLKRASVEAEEEAAESEPITSEEAEALAELNSEKNAASMMSENTTVFGDENEELVGSILQKGVGKKANALMFGKRGGLKNRTGGFGKDKEAIDAGKVKMAAKAAEARPLGVGGTIVFSDEASATHKKFEKDESPEPKIGSVKAPQKGAKAPRPDNVIDFQAHKKALQEGSSEDNKVRDNEYEYSKAIEREKVAQAEAVSPTDRQRHNREFKDAVVRASKDFLSPSLLTEAFGPINKVSVVPVDNPREKGFILVSSSENQFVSPDQLDRFKQKLTEEMRKDGTNMFDLGSTYEIETFEVDICDWASKFSQFSYRFKEEGTEHEVVISFLKRDDVYPDHKKMPEMGGVYRVHIQHLPPLIPLDFDVLLFFSKNNRLIPYLKKGGAFSSKQMNRLYKRGFKFLYIPPEYKDAFLAFYITLAINQDFQSLSPDKVG